MVDWSTLIATGAFVVALAGFARGEVRSRRSEARAERAEERAVAAEARADRAEKREDERLERERRSELPQLQITSFEPEGRDSLQRPVFLALVRNAGPGVAGAVRLELAIPDNPAERYLSETLTIEARQTERLRVAVPELWTGDSGQKLRAGISVLAVDLDSDVTAEFGGPRVQPPPSALA